jgi:2,4-dienoyl-CoA reductase-like NADH-dependent reductase (Old Yellow Enzyme family)
MWSSRNRRRTRLPEPGPSAHLPLPDTTGRERTVSEVVALLAGQDQTGTECPRARKAEQTQRWPSRAGSSLAASSCAVRHWSQRVEPIADMSRPMFSGVIIAAGGHTASTGTARIQRDQADLIAYGRLFIANPDLPARFRLNAPLAQPQRATFYGGGATGYADYPALNPDTDQHASRITDHDSHRLRGAR